jgi:hypothetical protein
MPISDKMQGYTHAEQGKRRGADGSQTETVPEESLRAVYEKEY